MRSSVASGRAVRVERSSQNSIFFFHFSFMLFLFWKETPQTHTLASLNPLWHPSLSCYFSYSLKKKSFLSPCPLSSFSQTTDGRGITSQTIYIISRSTTDPSYYVSLSLTLVCPYFDSVGHDGPLFFWGVECLPLFFSMICLLMICFGNTRYQIKKKTTTASPWKR